MDTKYLLSYKQRKAAFLLAAYKWSKKKVANEVGISCKKLNEWLDTEAFNFEIDDNIRKLSGVDREYRLDRTKKALPFLYEELLRRLAIDDEEIKDVPLKDIIKMISSITNEIRTDTPGEANQKVGHFALGNLSKRYMKSTSGKKKVGKKRKLGSKKVMGIEEVRRRYEDKKKENG